jgi:formylglycine-generating enzyme required for sulfatase activity
MKLVLIHKGQFEMGSHEEHFASENTVHHVTLTRNFYMAAYPVTLAQFRAFVTDTGYKTEAETNGKGGDGFDRAAHRFAHKPEYNWRNPGFEQADDHPVVEVSWYDADAFCKWLSKKEGKTYRLPTEAEFEYAARAGTTTRFSCGDADETLKEYANVADDALALEMGQTPRKGGWNDGYAFTSPVGKFKPNPWGLYDMHGNVWTWCNDWSLNRYQPEAVVDPAGPEKEATGGRVIRGGSWGTGPERCRSGNRVQRAPHEGFCIVGIRVARTVE